MSQRLQSAFFFVQDRMGTTHTGEGNPLYSAYKCKF